MQWFNIFFQLFPVIMNAMVTIAADKGKPVIQVVGDIISHLTPGMPNAPALGPTATPPSPQAMVTAAASANSPPTA